VALKMEPGLKNLLLAMKLGNSRSHPLAGWHILTILYGDHASAEVPRTLNFLSQQYNAHYLDTAAQEAPLTDAVLKGVLAVLSDQAHLIEVSPRKVRVRMQSGAYHMQQAPVYKITSQGIEYLSAMPKVLDAENTVTANTARIQEYCDLITQLSQPDVDSTSTALFNNFEKMLSAYSDVMKGMHKLDGDLDELANDLAFNHGSRAAEHLQAMLTGKAIPAFQQLIAQGTRVQLLANSTTFAERVARSQQGTDSLDAAKALDNQAALTTKFHSIQNHVEKHLTQLSLSFAPTQTAIDSSETDSIYMVFDTIMAAIQLLSQEYEHIQDQTVDLRDLTGKIDCLLTQYQTLRIPQAIPRHLAQDRVVADPTDLLAATTLGPIKYVADQRLRQVATAADNPTIAQDQVIDADGTSGLAEFKRLVMIDAQHGEVRHDLTFETQAARDEVTRLYSGTGYDRYTSFAPFGRPVAAIRALPETGPIWLHCQAEDFSVQLPSGFSMQFQEGDD